MSARCLAISAGSPPQAWGRRQGPNISRNCRSVHPHRRGDDAHRDFQVSGGQRFTPTGVGTTRKVLKCPRKKFGSPPQAWGRRPPAGPVEAAVRFTPTGVGTTSELVMAAVWARFTPTGVGTTVRRRRSALGPSVHPHRRGDDQKIWRDRGATRRFTPTGVGTTLPVVAALNFTRVHPHRRGDDTMSPLVTAPTAGSPPQAWGRRDRARQRGGGVRFTPTGVGTTTWRQC